MRTRTWQVAKNRSLASTAIGRQAASFLVPTILVLVAFFAGCDTLPPSIHTRDALNIRFASLGESSDLEQLYQAASSKSQLDGLQVPSDFSKNVEAKFATRGLRLGEPVVVTSPAGIPTTLAGFGVSFPPAFFSDAKADAATRLQHFIESYKKLFSPTGRHLEFNITQQDTWPDGTVSVRFQQVVNGVPVEGATAVASIRTDGDIAYFHGHIASVAADLALVAPAIDPAIVESLVPPPHDALTWASDPELIWYSPVLGDRPDGDPLRLAWKIITADSDGLLFATSIDAIDGAPLEIHQVSKEAMARTVSDANFQSLLPGVLKYRDSPYYCSGCSDTEVRAAKSYLQTLYGFWMDRFGWLSWDGADATMDVTIRYDSSTMISPFWSGYPTDMSPPPDSSRPRAVFDAGNLSQDFLVHEFGHGMNQATANLAHSRHSGALDEHLADCLAALVGDDWVLFEGTNWASTFNGTRNVSHPELSALAWDSCTNCAFTGQPDRWTRFGTNPKDSWLVHYNAGIGNKVCFLIADGSGPTGFNGQVVAGQGRAVAAEVFHNVLRYYLTSGSTFEDYVPALSAAALKYDVDHGLSTFPTTLATLDALTAVGIWDPPSTLPTSTHANGRVAATDHATTSNAEALLVAFRNSATNMLTFMEYGPSTGWLQPYLPGESRELLGGPDFVQERSSLALDTVVYPVALNGGGQMIVSATVQNGLILVTHSIFPYWNQGDPISGARLGSDVYVLQRTQAGYLQWANASGQYGYVSRAGTNYLSYAPADVVESLGRLWVVYQPSAGSGVCLTNATESELQAATWSTPFCPGNLDGYSAAMIPKYVSGPEAVLGAPTLTQWDPSPGAGAYLYPDSIRLLVSSVVTEPDYPTYSLAQVWVRDNGFGTVVGQERNVMQPIAGTALAGKAAHVGEVLHQVFATTDGVLQHRKKRGY